MWCVMAEEEENGEEKDSASACEAVCERALLRGAEVSRWIFTWRPN